MNTRFAAITLLVASCCHTSVARCEDEVALFAAAPGNRQTTLEIQTDPQTSGAVLRISRSALQAAGYELRPIEPQKTGDWSPSRSRSIVAASAMSLGLAGVFLLRSNRRVAITTGLVAAIFVGSFGMQAWGNGAPPPSYQPRPIILPGQQPQFQPGAAFDGNRFIGSGTIGAGAAPNQFQQPSVGQSILNRQPTSPLPVVNPAANPLTFPTTNLPANPIANPLTNPLANPLTVPSALPTGTSNSSSNLSNLIEMKPGAGAVTLDPTRGPQLQNYHGTVAIEVTDDDAGVRLVLGTKPK